MPNLRLVSLTCHRPNDSGEYSSYDIGDIDEPFLIVNGAKIWSERMKADEIEDLSKIKPIPFEYSCNLELWEKDPGVLGEDDLLGQILIESNMKSSSILSQDFKCGTSKYTLNYKVE